MENNTVEIVSNCCGATSTGGGDELWGTGRCSDCHEQCEFVSAKELRAEGIAQMAEDSYRD